MKWLTDVLGLVNARFLSGVQPGDVALIPEGMRAHSLERYAERPLRRRSLVLLRDAKDFLAHLESHDCPNNDALVFLSTDGLGATAVLNFGFCTPSWQDDVVVLDPLPTPLAADLLALTKGGATGVVTQKHLLDFIDEWGGALSFTRDGKQVPQPEARDAWAKMTAQKLHEARADRSQAFERELSATERLSLGSGLPTAFSFTAPIFHGFNARPVAVRLRAAEAGGLAVDLRIDGWSQVLDDMRVELRDAVAALELPVRLGRLATSTSDMVARQ